MRTLTDLDYGGGRLIDLYLPDGGDGAAALVTWSHGSAFLGENGRDGAEIVAEHLVPLGYAVAGIMSPSTRRAVFPAQLEAVHDSLDYLATHAAEWRIDPGRIASMGESSGGWFACMAGLATDRVRAVVAYYPPTDLAAMNRHAIEAGYRPRALPLGPGDPIPDGAAMDHDDPGSPESLLLAGPVQERLELASAASPVTYVRPDAPPVVILHGDRDVLVPVGQGRALAERLAAAGAPVTFVRLPAAGHGEWDAWQVNPALNAGAIAYDGRGDALVERGPVDLTWSLITDFLGNALRV